MIEIYKNVFVGNELDYEANVRHQNGWGVVHACKEPYHRQTIGYTGRACAKTHPEYLLAKRGDRLILNLVDVEDPSWVSPIIVDETMKFLDDEIKRGLKVLIHCNQGLSRSAGLGLLYLAHIGQYHNMDFVTAENMYKKIYPLYQPAGGIRGYCINNWNNYRV